MEEEVSITRYEAIRWCQNVLRVGDDVNISTEAKHVCEVGRIRDIFCRKDDGSIHIEISWFFIKDLMENELRQIPENMRQIEEKQLFFDSNYTSICPIASIKGKVKVIAKGHLKEAKNEYEQFVKIWEKEKTKR